MHVGRLGLLLPFDANNDAVANGLLMTVRDGVPGVTVFHSRTEGRALIEAFRTGETSESVDSLLRLLEGSMLPETALLPSVNFAPPLSREIMRTIFSAAEATAATQRLNFTTTTQPRFCRFNLPIAEPADEALLALIDDGAAWIHVFRSKEQGRAIVGRHAHMLTPAGHAKMLALLEECERLPETSAVPAETVKGYAAQAFCIACEMENERKANAN